MPHKRIVHEIGLAFVEVAIILPVLLTTVLAAGYLYSYVRTYQVVKSAAEMGSQLGSSAEMKSVSNASTSYLKWSQDLGGATPYLPFTFTAHEHCRSQGSAADQTACFEEQKALGRYYASVWSNYDQSWQGPDKSFPLPFMLNEASSTTNGYYPTQMLPFIGIERACWEPYNESGSKITGTGRLYSTADSGECSHVKPMYWQSPEKADFDGDGKEDIVFFRPRGTSTTWGAHSALADVDFIVYYSGAGYSSTAGMGYFNLATDSSAGTPGETPNDIPIVADYDRDGLSDYAVFDPRTGDYRIAFSASGYRVIGSGNLGISDASGQRGLIAIPGTFTNSGQMKVLVIATGSASAANRFDMYITPALSIEVGELTAVDGTTINLPNGHLVTNNEVSSANIFKVKPQPGTVSVPAFADYDDDGIVELGYLSWYGGNLARQVAGKVKGIRNTTVANLAEQNDEPGTTPMNTRINPFDMDFDSSGNLYVVDSVDGRIWRIDSDSLEGTGTSDTSSIHTVMPNHATQVRRAFGATPQDLFPSENVYNLVSDARALTAADTDAAATASVRQLRNPRKIVVASSYDNAMYIADWGNSRILRVSGASLPIGTASSSSVVLGSTSCKRGICAALKDPGKPNDYDLWDTVRGKYQIWPSALAIVPDPRNNQRYWLAFSTGNSVYLITHGNPTGGPIGQNGEKIWKIAGQTVEPTLVLNATQTNYATNMNLDNATASSLCPVIDMKYTSHESPGSLYLALSCSLIKTPSEAFRPERAAGGIVRLIPSMDSNKYYQFYDENNEGLINTFSILVGSFYAYPCANSFCSGATVDGVGLYQRKINYGGATSRNTDVINPVDMALGGLGQVYFIDQWNEVKTVEDDVAFPNPPHREDRTHVQGIVLWDGPTHSAGLSALTNPLLYGGGLLPVWGADWYSPYNTASPENLQLWIKAHTAPVKNVPIPAVASLAISNGRIYSATPFLKNPSAYASTDPLYVNPNEVGMIYSIDLDQDGDGVADDSDDDIDGDGVRNASDITNRSPWCPEIFGGNSTQRCRPQERLGLPRQTFFKLTGGGLQLGGEGSVTESGALSSRTYGEFLLYASIAECGTLGDCQPDDVYTAGKVKPEVWATLFNWGDDQDFSGTDACTNANSGRAGDPYAHCKPTATGPIAAPLPLHAFVNTSYWEDGGSTNSYPGYHYLAKTQSNLNRPVDEGLFLFPTILSSLYPKENGIKPTRQVPLDAKSPGISKSGILCRDYHPEVYDRGDGVVAEPQHQPFRFNFDNYLNNYYYSGFEYGVDSIRDNDPFNYLADCSVQNATQFSNPDSRLPAVEGVILQLDHDDTAEKESSNQSATHWPVQNVTGSPFADENSRRLIFIDHDGSGARDPTFLAPSSIETTPQDPFASDPMISPTILVATGLRNSSDANDPSTINFIDALRAPFNDLDVITTLGWSNTSIITPPYMRYDNTKQEGINYSFDLGRQIGAYSRDNTLFLALDFEPYLGRTLEIGTRQDVGAAMYTNYARSTRFRSGGQNLPAALQAARNVLALSFGLSDGDFVASEQQLARGKAYVTFLANDQPCVGSVDSTTKLACDSIKVSYVSSYLGHDTTISITQPLNLGYLNGYQETCDPEVAPDGFDCS
ncbi:MAG: hypothetical protein K1X79_05080 [Oligoflexia bacterium]|nr:hypothetical protein [Oligoflexia bacterium]